MSSSMVARKLHSTTHRPPSVSESFVGGLKNSKQQDLQRRRTSFLDSVPGWLRRKFFRNRKTLAVVFTVVTSLAYSSHLNSAVLGPKATMGDFDLGKRKKRLTTFEDKTLHQPSGNAFGDTDDIVAHAVSLISCSKAARTSGMLDAFLILRHSIHQNSRHRFADWSNEISESIFQLYPNHNHLSRYSYHMYAFVHKGGGCEQHSEMLSRLGYRVRVVPTPGTML
jgi:hypothetical protein